MRRTLESQRQFYWLQGSTCEPLTFYHHHWRVERGDGPNSHSALKQRTTSLHAQRSSPHIVSEESFSEPLCKHQLLYRLVGRLPFVVVSRAFKILSLGKQRVNEDLRAPRGSAGRFFKELSAYGRAVKVEDRGRAVSCGSFSDRQRHQRCQRARTIKDNPKHEARAELAHNNAGTG